MKEIKFRFGYHNFHSNLIMNFQFNRWYSSGWGKVDEWAEIGRNVENFSDWKEYSLIFAKRAEQEKRYDDAFIYYRAAEFFTPHSDNDKIYLYDKCIDMFDTAFQSFDYERLSVPYKNGELPLMRVFNNSVAKKDNKHVILIHGGFDSFIEEFYPYARFLSDSPYEVYLYEGPGQGGARRKGGFYMNDDWANPTSAVIDYLGCSSVTLIGVSMGGVLAPLAAISEPRIKRLVSYNAMYDLFDVWIGHLPKLKEITLRLLFAFKCRKIVNNMYNKIREKDELFDWSVDHGCYITGTKTPYDRYIADKKYSLKKKAHLIKQDYLMFAGQDEYNGKAYRQLDLVAKNATGVKSLTSYKVSRDDMQCYIAQHCQVGNQDYAMGLMKEWLNNTKDSI